MMQRIVGVARSAETRATALERGCVTEATDDLSNACDGADLVVLAVPVATALKLMPRVAEAVGPDAIITDVGSTKASIVSAAAMHLNHPRQFVGSHPMAGGEQTGPAAADPDLFVDRPAIVTPVGATEANAVATVEQLWRALGSRLHRLPPDVHDRMVGRISHLPHLLACVLMELAERDGALSVASTGLCDVSRPASGDPRMWADIFTDNRQALLDLIEEAIDRLQQWRVTVDTSDDAGEAVRQRLAVAKQIRDDWRSKCAK
jgi:prephenate dehydrogenase